MVRQKSSSNALLGYDEGRKDDPLLTEVQWHRALSRNGFSGIDHASKDSDGPDHVATMMVSKLLRQTARLRLVP